MVKLFLKDLNLKEITAYLQKAGFQSFRGKQIFNWLFVNGARCFDEMKNLPSEIKQFLSKNFEIGGVKSIEEVLTAGDGTKKILFKLYDNNYIEGVLMPEKGWWTLCISTQVGCPLKCVFCNTGKGGFIRDLSVAEIIDQILITNKEFCLKNMSESQSDSSDEELDNIDKTSNRERQCQYGKIRNIVLMGMGEPFLNTKNVLKALQLMTAPDGMALSPKRITVSTSGIVEGIKELGESNVGVNLAISLNAVDNKTREKLMPITKKYPIESIIDACKKFPLTKRRRITFEYILLSGINDSLEEANKLASLLKGMPCKINLIPFNRHDESQNYYPPTENRIEEFRKVLSEKHFTVAIRYSKGKDILAACGQLAGHIRKKELN